MQSSTTTIAAGHAAAKPATTTSAVASKPVKTPSYRRGLKKAEAVAIVEKFNFPTTPFTFEQIFEATGICHWYLIEYVKKNAKNLGQSPKRPGIRGKHPQLYQFVK